MADAENFYGGGLVQGHVVVIWCALFVTSQFNVIFMFPNYVLAKFVDIICIFLYIHSPYLMCHCTEYKLSALQVGLSEKNKLNATTQQFITAKISGCVLKQGSETLITASEQFTTANEAVLIYRRTRAVEHRCAAGRAVAHPGLEDRILINTTGLPTCLHQRKPDLVPKKSEKAR